ncbi:MAG: DUF92 domain-containing protein [Chloroflexi bacterium]|nr:DUF92 domain-containing protein [Chloroflexota bacterium]
MVNSFNLGQLLIGLVSAAGIGAFAYWRGALTRSGVVGAILTGTLILGLGGWQWGLLLIAFFASSSLLSFYREREKLSTAEKFAKGHRRDLAQTLANGGLAALLAALSRVYPSPLWFFACAGAMAAVNADTWATEIGVLSTRAPRLITTGASVEPGTSGGVTALGALASFTGALVIAALGSASILLSHENGTVATALLYASTLGGIAGSLIDSLLGASIQAIYWCDYCNKETESAIHRCGNPTRRLRGLSVVNNDMVNFITSAAGAAVASIIGSALL